MPSKSKYEENKKRAEMSLSPFALENLKLYADSLETSRSELIEQFARDPIATTQALKIQGLLKEDCPKEQFTP